MSTVYVCVYCPFNTEEQKVFEKHFNEHDVEDATNINTDNSDIYVDDPSSNACILQSNTNVRNIAVFTSSLHSDTNDILYYNAKNSKFKPWSLRNRDNSLISNLSNSNPCPKGIRNTSKSLNSSFYNAKNINNTYNDNDISYIGTYNAENAQSFDTYSGRNVSNISYFNTYGRDIIETNARDLENADEILHSSVYNVDNDSDTLNSNVYDLESTGDAPCSVRNSDDVLYSSKNASRYKTHKITFSRNTTSTSTNNIKKINFTLHSNDYNIENTDNVNYNINNMDNTNDNVKRTNEILYSSTRNADVSNSNTIYEDVDISDDASSPSSSKTKINTLHFTIEDCFRNDNNNTFEFDMNEHYNNNVYICYICEEYSNNKNFIADHIAKNHENALEKHKKAILIKKLNVYRDFMDEEFKARIMKFVRKHKKTRSLNKSKIFYACSICLESSEWKGKTYNHILNYHDVKCKSINYMFSLEKIVPATYYSTKAFGLKRFKCKLCFLRANWRSQIRKHCVRKHEEYYRKGCPYLDVLSEEEALSTIDSYEIKYGKSLKGKKLKY